MTLNLQENVGLKSLNVSFNGFGTEGTYVMAQAIANNRTLKHLDMSKNRITDIDITQLTKQLKNNETLETLRVCIGRIVLFKSVLKVK